MTLRELVAWLYKRLEERGGRYEGFYDTDVREKLHEVLEAHFIEGKPTPTIEWDFGLYTLKANDEVSEVIAVFLDSACPLADEQQLDRQLRWDALHDSSIRTPQGRTYVEFIGC